VLLAGFFLFGIGASLIADLIGVLFPALCSFIELEEFTEKKKDREENLKFWLRYWAVFGCFTLFEKFTKFLLWR
jgi:hypothetical protein